MSTHINPRKLLAETLARQPALTAVRSGPFRHLNRKGFLQLVVAYCNGQEIKPSASLVREAGTDFMRFNGLERLAVLMMSLTQGFRLKTETGEPTKKETRMIQTALEDLRKEGHKLRAAVSWLCSEKKTSPAASPKRLQRLLRLRELTWGRYPDIDKTSEDFITYFETHGIKHFTFRPSLQDGTIILLPRCIHFVDVFCAFLLNECVEKIASELPLKFCLECKQLFAPHARAEFCSRKCQWRNYWTPARRRDDVYVKRLEERIAHASKRKHGFSGGDLQLIARSRKIMDRLDRIENDWKDWRKIIDKVLAIRSKLSNPRSA